VAVAQCGKQRDTASPKTARNQKSVGEFVQEKSTRFFRGNRALAAIVIVTRARLAGFRAATLNKLKNETTARIHRQRSLSLGAGVHVGIHLDTAKFPGPSIVINRELRGWISTRRRGWEEARDTFNRCWRPGVKFLRSSASTTWMNFSWLEVAGLCRENQAFGKNGSPSGLFARRIAGDHASGRRISAPHARAGGGTIPRWNEMVLCPSWAGRRRADFLGTTSWTRQERHELDQFFHQRAFRSDADADQIPAIPHRISQIGSANVGAMLQRHKRLWGPSSVRGRATLPQVLPAFVALVRGNQSHFILPRAGDRLRGGRFVRRIRTSCGWTTFRITARQRHRIARSKK